MADAPGARRIVWLASYPKSGNTWMRAFLSNYLADGDAPVDINSLDTGGPIASARAVFDDAVGVEASDLTQDEIERYRPRVYLQVAANSSETLYLKIHDAFTYTPDGSPLVPAGGHKGRALPHPQPAGRGGLLCASRRNLGGQDGCQDERSRVRLC